MSVFKDSLGDTPYPASPGFEKSSDTSKLAAESIAPKAGRLRASVLAEVRDRGVDGTTCDEVEVALSLRHQTASARIRELALNGSIVDTGRKRPTRSKRPAVVYCAVGTEPLK